MPHYRSAQKTEMPHPIPRRNLADAMLAAVAVLSSLLVVQHFGIVRLIGSRIGPDLPADVVLGLPFSFVVLAIIVGIVASWMFVRNKEVSAPFRIAVRLGGLVLVIHVGALLLSGMFCPYSSALCVLFFVFWYAVERSYLSPKLDYVTPICMLAGSALVGSFLYMAVVEGDRARADLDLVRSSTLRSSELESLTASEAEIPSQDQAGSNTPQNMAISQRSRPHFGKADAQVQVVAYYDYQSQGCRRIDANLRSLLAQHGDKMSLVIRHFPLCSDCNLAVSRTLSPDACRLAKAVEAAFSLRGMEGFLHMHEWILGQSGRITEDAIAASFSKLENADKPEFIKTMNSKEVMATVLGDVVEAEVSGVSTSPTLFVNGERLVLLSPETELKYILESASAQLANAEPVQPVEPQPIETAFVESDVFPQSLQMAVLCSTVRIHSSTQKTSGTGVIFASKGPFVFVLTAEHVVGQSKWVTTETFTSESYPRANSRITASVVARSVEADLAVIRYATSEAAPKSSPLAAAGAVVGGDVFSVGCDQQGPPTCVADRITRSAQVRRGPTSPAIKMWQVMQAPVVGRSGGPLIDQRGQLVGVASGMSDGKGYFCHIDEIRDFLRKSNLSFGRIGPEGIGRSESK